MREIAAGRQPAVPAVAEHLWGWFWSLDALRSGNGFGPNALNPVEVDAWARLAGIGLRPWEFAMLLRMDRARLNDAPAEPTAARAVSPALFDALFA